MIENSAIIDCVERLREYLTFLDPRLENRLERLTGDAICIDNEDARAEYYLGARLNVDCSTSAGRRKMHGVLKKLRYEKESGKTQEIREDPEIRYIDISEKEKNSLWKGLHILDKLYGANAFSFQPGEGIQNHVNRLWASSPGLSGIKAYRFLWYLGYPVAVPDAPKRKMLFRLGWLTGDKAGKNAFLEFGSICEKASRLGGLHIRALNLLLDLYSGVEKSALKELPVCGKKPSCLRCILGSYCIYKRYFDGKKLGGVRRMPMHSWLPDNQPREKLERKGAVSLFDEQLLAIILRTGVGNISALDLAREVLSRFKGLRGVREASIKELCEIHGIGRVKAIEIKAAVELGRRFLTERPEAGDVIQESKDIFRFYHNRFTGLKQETFFLVILNTKNKPVKESEISRGSLNSCTVHPREVFKEAIRESASGVVFIHNHPSGDPGPSETDIMLTKRLVKVGDLLGIRVLDHIIFGENCYFSFRDEGLI